MNWITFHLNPQPYPPSTRTLLFRTLRCLPLPFPICHSTYTAHSRIADAHAHGHTLGYVQHILCMGKRMSPCGEECMDHPNVQARECVLTLVAAPNSERLLFQSLLERLPQAVVLVETDDGRMALEYVRRMRFDLAIIGIPLARVNGLTVVRQALRASPGIRVVIIAAIDDPACLLEAIRIGVHGYLSTTTSIDELADTMQRILAGEMIVDTVISTRVLRRLAASGSER